MDEREATSDGLSPSLGGDRASEPLPQPQEAPPELEAAGTSRAPTTDFFNPALGFVATLEAFGRDFGTLLNATVESLEQQLPEALAAFDGLFEAVESAIGPLQEDPPEPPG